MKLIKIAAGKYAAVINLSRGANAISLRHGELPILREPPSFDEKPDSDYLYGMPLLFPVNRIEGGEFTFEGRKYSFGINEKKTGCYIHGTVHSRDFQLIESTESSVKAALYSKKGEIYEGFPHAFGIELTYSLSESGLDIPQVTRLMMALRRRGLDVPQNIYTVEEATKAIGKLFLQASAQKEGSI